MPIYEYVCQSCGNDFEKLTSFSDTSVPACPSCFGTDVARQLSRPAIHFKGSGWYINDSKVSTKESANGTGSINGNGKEGDSSAKPSETSADAKAEPSKAESAKTGSSQDGAPKSESSKGAEKAKAA